MLDTNLHGPTPEQFKIICENLGENVDRFETNIKLLKDWIDFQPHLPKNYNLELLPIFLRGCKHDLERAKRKIDTYFTVRTTIPELFSKRDPISNEIVTAARVFYMAPLPKLTSDGCRVTFHKFTGCDLSLFQPKEVFRLILMMADIRMLEECAITGDIFVFDVKHLTAGHCARLANLTLLSRLLAVIQNAYPQRLTQIYMINASSHIHRLIALFKKCMKEKMRNRFQIFTSASCLTTLLSKDQIPEDYGGNLPTLFELHNGWQKKLTASRSWFAKQSDVKTDNSKRVGKNTTNHLLCSQDDIFGTEGAFRKLNID